MYSGALPKLKHLDFKMLVTYLSAKLLINSCLPLQKYNPKVLLFFLPAQTKAHTHKDQRDNYA